MTIAVESSIRKWKKDPKFLQEYDALEEEYVLAEALIQARQHAQMSQAEVAKKMGTLQPAVARLESGKARPSLATLQKYGYATGHRLVLLFQPLKKAPAPKKEEKRKRALSPQALLNDVLALEVRERIVELGLLPPEPAPVVLGHRRGLVGGAFGAGA